MHEIFYDELRKLKVRFMEMGINVSEQIYRSTKSVSYTHLTLPTTSRV